VLASNAHDCYHALGKKIGKPSNFKTWLEAMPKSFQERAQYIQDFAKHGFKDLDEDAPFDLRIAEGLMVESVSCHEQVYGKRSPLMGLYMARVLLEHPTWSLPNVRPQILEGASICNLGSGSRKQFFDEYSPRMDELFARGFHSESP